MLYCKIFGRLFFSGPDCFFLDHGVVAKIIVRFVSLKTNLQTVSQMKSVMLHSSWNIRSQWPLCWPPADERSGSWNVWAATSTT